MTRAVHFASAFALLALVAGCDKCGNFNLNGPWGAKVCSEAKPQP